MVLVVSLSLIGELGKVTITKSLQIWSLLNTGITDRREEASCEWGLKSLMLRRTPDLLDRKYKPL